jgi:hypothetical protein
MAETIKIPKFRKVGRVEPWMQGNEYFERIPQAEELFFSSRESDHVVLDALMDYHETVGEISDELKNLIYEKAKKIIPSADQNCGYVHDFLIYCSHDFHVRGDRRRQFHQDVEDVSRYIDLFAGKSDRLLRWAKWKGERLPSHLEDTIDDPDALLEYAVEVVKGRVPEHLENVFHKDVHVATRYAFAVIRGFAPCKLPDHLHNAVILESFKNPDDREIKNYMMASESDPNKVGNQASED